jgi:hypothetical protein
MDVWLWSETPEVKPFAASRLRQEYEMLDCCIAALLFRR